MKCLLLMSVVLVGCNPVLHNPEIYHVDPEIEPYVLRFVEEGAKRGYAVHDESLVASFAVLGDSDLGKVLGECDMATSPPSVAIDWNYWRLYDDTTHEEIVFHELGHCLLRREHIKGVESLMNEILVDHDTYRDHRTEYLDELFAGVPTTKILRGKLQ